jgi:hypothetical protein
MSWQQSDGQPQQAQQPEWGSAQPQPPYGAPQPAQFGQPQPAQFGQPQPGQFGQPEQQPGQFGAPQPGQPTPPPFYTPHPYEKKRSGFGTRQIIILVVLVLVVGGYYGYKHFTGQVQATSLTTGECFNGGGVGDQDISTVNSVACTQAHSAQVLGLYTMTDSTYPDDTTLSTELDAACKPFNSAVNSDNLPSDAEFAYIVPDAQSFASGNKTVDCLVQSDTEDLTSSVLP